MKLLRFTIHLDPRTKKNHQQIAGSGPRCPYCKKPQRQFVRQGRAHDLYASEALRFLRPRPEQPISTPVQVTCLFYMKTRRRVDMNNLIAAVDDLLVNAGILSDDNSAVIKSHDGTRVFYDKENPRTEIFISDYKEEENGNREALPDR